MIRYFISIVGMCTMLVSAGQAYARPGDWVALNSAMERFDSSAKGAFLSSMVDIESVLRHYRPEGAVIENLRLQWRGPRGLPRVFFTTVVKFGWPSIRTDVVADVVLSPSTCPNGENGHAQRIELLLDDSDKLVATNASRFRVDLCAFDNSDGSFSVHARSSMQSGPRPNLAEGFIREVLADQTKPMFKALREATMIRMLETQN